MKILIIQSIYPEFLKLPACFMLLGIPPMGMLVQKLLKVFLKNCFKLLTLKLKTIATIATLISDYKDVSLKILPFLMEMQMGSEELHDLQVRGEVNIQTIILIFRKNNLILGQSYLKLLLLPA